MEARKLGGQVALITGASRGLGSEIAIQLADLGAMVVVNYRSNQKDGEQIVDYIRSKGNNAIAIQADVSKEADVYELFQKIQAEIGNVDILVNNAGINPTIPIEELGLKDFQKALDVNLTSAFLTTQLAIPSMKAKKYGRIINMTSIAAQTGGVIGPHYAASKAGMVGLTHSYAKLLAGSGITVNAIAPALIETEMIKDNPNIKPDLIPIGRFGQPGEVASVVTMLAGNGYITGQTLNVNGGWYMSS